MDTRTERTEPKTPRRLNGFVAVHHPSLEGVVIIQEDKKIEYIESITEQLRGSIDPSGFIIEAVSVTGFLKNELLRLTPEIFL